MDLRNNRNGKIQRGTTGWVILLLIVHLGLVAWNGYLHAPVIDEVAYLPAGVSHLQLGSFEAARVSPPLVRMIAALPVLFANPEVDWRGLDDQAGARSEWVIGPRFVELNGSRIFWLVTLGRWACLSFCLLGGFVCFKWATELYGRSSGFMALLLWCFSPNILGHGALLTPDIGGAATGVLAGYTFWRWLGDPGWARLWVAGACLGVALSTRTTWVVLVPGWIVLWVMRRWESRKWQPFTLIALLGIALFVLNLSYGFSGTLKSLGDYRFVSRTFQDLKSRIAPSKTSNESTCRRWLASLPVPLPKDYVMGMDSQRHDFERPRWSYLAGESRKGGWWYYYLYGFAVKLPLGILLLFVGATALTLKKYRASWRSEFCLIIPMVFVFLAVSSQTGFSQHVRYSFGILPFLFVWCSKLMNPIVTHPKPVKIATIICIVFTVISSLLVYPHSQSYFNELSGGPSKGHAHLVDSNVGWGQDLLLLKKWRDSEPDSAPLYVAHYGEVDPRLAGIRFQLPPIAEPEKGLGDLPGQLPPGFYAISVSLLRGRPYSIFDGKGGRKFCAPGSFTYFQRLIPVGRIGYSINLYRVAP